MDDQSQLGVLGGLGPFFAVDIRSRESVPEATWQPLSRLLQPIGVRMRIDQIRHALASTVRCEPREVPWRVAASVAHLGLVARLISPQLGVLVIGGALNLDPEQTWWQPVVGGPVLLSVSDEALAPWPADDGVLVDGSVRALTDLFTAESVSAQVLWGKVASAINGAYNAIVGVRPELAEAARLHVLGALDRPFMAGMSNGRPGPTFRRKNCCLIYRLGSPAANRRTRQVCGDCVLGTSAATAG